MATPLLVRLAASRRISSFCSLEMVTVFAETMMFADGDTLTSDSSISARGISCFARVKSSRCVDDRVPSLTLSPCALVKSRAHRTSTCSVMNVSISLQPIGELLDGLSVLIDGQLLKQVFDLHFHRRILLFEVVSSADRSYGLRQSSRRDI